MRTRTTELRQEERSRGSIAERSFVRRRAAPGPRGALPRLAQTGAGSQLQARAAVVPLAVIMVCSRLCPGGWSCSFEDRPQGP